VGFPIRKSSDQSSFAAPQGLSQRTTSFIASQRQGIHRMLLRHLITLMIDVRRPRTSGYHPKIRPADLDQKDHCGSNLSVRALACRTYPIGGAVTPSLVVGTRRPNSRICSLFTISNTRAATCVAGELPLTSGHRALLARAIALVEPDGIEPTTSCLQSTRSPN
jgi:hypothetical protein